MLFGALMLKTRAGHGSWPAAAGPIAGTRRLEQARLPNSATIAGRMAFAWERWGR
jgi:hypothetical protein